MRITLIRNDSIILYCIKSPCCNLVIFIQLDSITCIIKIMCLFEYMLLNRIMYKYNNCTHKYQF